MVWLYRLYRLYRQQMISLCLAQDFVDLLASQLAFVRVNVMLFVRKTRQLSCGRDCVRDVGLHVPRTRVRIAAFFRHSFAPGDECIVQWFSGCDRGTDVVKADQIRDKVRKDRPYVSCFLAT